MYFWDIIKSNDSKAKLSNLKNLVVLAAADGRIAKEELAAIAEVMSRDGLTNSDLERCIKHPESVKFVAPKSDEQRLRYLHDMVILMLCDGDINKNEVALCKITALALGYKHEVIDALVYKTIEDVKQEILFDAIIDEANC